MRVFVLLASDQTDPAPAIVYGQRVNCFEVTAGSCRSLLHSEWKGKFAYRELFLIKNRNFHSALENKTM